MIRSCFNQDRRSALVHPAHRFASKGPTDVSPVP